MKHFLKSYIICIILLFSWMWGDCEEGKVELWGECYSIENTTVLDLSHNELTGSIPLEIGQLTNLTTLDLQVNELTGSIPPEIGNLTNLTFLDLRNNELTGEIPPEIGNLYNLTWLSLCSNELTGEIPSEIDNLTNLEKLWFYNNELTGEIPPEIGNLNTLEVLQLHNNELTGEIPPEIGNLSNLISLNLGENLLTGSIPPEIGSLSNLAFLDLGNNELTGGIPSEIGNLTNLNNLYLNYNLLTGSIPSEIENLTSLTHLILDDNQLTGEIPPEVGNLSILDKLQLHKNQLTGSIPIEIGNLTYLDYLKLYDNQLTGEIPESICDLDISWSSSSSFNISNNQLCPPYPSCNENYVGYQDTTNCSNNGLDCTADDDTEGVELWGECYSIENTTNLNLSMSGLTGEIPPEIGNLTNLTDLILHYNQLTGEIPSEIGNLTNLTRLYLWENQLTGSIPPEIGELTNLTSLLLDFNQLTGEIPSEIGGLINLSILELSHNELTGSIPPEIGGLINLSILGLSHTKLTGFIPPEIGGLINLNILGLSYSELTGSIPPEIGGLINLSILGLSHNELIGSISPEIGNLNNLTELYLGDNQLTGEIPESICNLVENNCSIHIENNKLCPPYPSCIEDYIGEQDCEETSFQSPDFSLEITTSGGDVSYNLKIGFSPNATDGYDNGIDQYAPPLPPAPSLYTSLIWENDSYFTQIVNGSVNDLVEHIWEIQLQYPEDNLITLNWDNGCLSVLGTFILQDTFGGTLLNVDMTTVDSLVLDNPEINILKLKVTPNEYSSEVPPEEFEYFPNPTAGTFIGTATVNGDNAEECDWIAAFDENGNCAGSAALIIDSNLAWINIPIYGDDSTTPDIDEGMNPGENFILKLWDASSGLILEYSESFDCWSNQNGAPMPGCGGIDEVYDFSFGSMNSVILSTNPQSFSLHQNYPNPFNPITSLRYDLPEQAQVTLTVYDLMGREITQLVSTTQEAGYKSIQWNAADSFGKPVSAGVYLYQIRTAGFVQTRKMVLLK